MEEDKILSASRVSTLEKCSWIYWCQYHLKMPQKGNSGQLRGIICHLVLELLLKKRHKKHYSSITKKNHINGSPAVDKIVKKFIKSHELLQDGEDHYTLCSDMILVGLTNDYFNKGYKLLEPEYQFNIENEDPPYKVRGYIDKAATNSKKILISDYKTSKEKFKGDSLTSNLQAMVYSLAARKLWPKLKSAVRFLFLKFPSDPAQELHFNNDQLDGLEHYLSHVYSDINSFDEKKAKLNYAADQPNPGPKGGFKGPILCAPWCRKPGQLKKDGTPMWHCEYKFAFDYYALMDAGGNVQKTSRDKADLKPEKGEKIKLIKYKGCPRHNY